MRGAVTSSLHNTRARADIMEERDTNSSLSITTAVNSSTTEAAVATHNSPLLTITSPGHIPLLRGHSTRRCSLNNSNNSLWRWSSSLHNTRNPSHSSNSTINRCTCSLSNNIPIT